MLASPPTELFGIARLSGVALSQILGNNRTCSGVVRICLVNIYIAQRIA